MTPFAAMLPTGNTDLRRLQVGPAEAARPQEREIAVGVLPHLAGLVVDFLLEIGPRRLRGAQVALEAFQACRSRNRRERNQEQET